MRPRRRRRPGSNGRRPRSSTSSSNSRFVVGAPSRRGERDRDRRRRRARVRDAAPQRLVGPRHPGLRVPAARARSSGSRSSPRSRHGSFPSTRSSPRSSRDCRPCRIRSPPRTCGPRALRFPHCSSKSRSRRPRCAPASIAAHRVAGRGGRRAVLVARAADRARDLERGVAAHRRRVRDRARSRAPIPAPRAAASSS